MASPDPRGATILRVDASARRDGSQTRLLGDALVRRLLDTGAAARVVTRDVAAGLEIVDAAWVEANLTPADARDDAQRARLALSETLIEELFGADIVVIGVPVYNFGVPAALKAWIDLVTRARRTFRYGENGSEGLLAGRRAYLLVASGGTAVDGDADFATPYLRHVLGFVGIDDVTVVAADRGAVRGPEAMASALERLDAALPERAA